MPFLTQLYIPCQDEGWASAIYIKIETKTYDVTHEFAYITEANINDVAKQHWTSPDDAINKHTIGHNTCNACLLAKCLLVSITFSLTMIIIKHIPQQ